MDNLITVNEYAKSRNISRQAVYSQIKNGKLSKCVKTIDGKQMIDLSMIEAPARKEAVKQVTRQELVNSDIDFLRQQIEVKDRQIQDLQRTIDALTDALKAAQALHAADKKLLTPAEAPRSETASSDSSSMDEPKEESKSFWQRLFG